jgi:hypothetical protein
LDGVHEGSSGLGTLKAPELLSGDDDDLVASVNGDVLGALSADKTNQLAEARLRILQDPMSGQAG